MEPVADARAEFLGELLVAKEHLPGLASSSIGKGKRRGIRWRIVKRVFFRTPRLKTETKSPKGCQSLKSRFCGVAGGERTKSTGDE